MSPGEPAYIATFKCGLLKKKIQQAGKILKDCNLCPRACRVDRVAGRTGICKTARNAWVSSFNAHFGEEAPLVGNRGSGTIFFTHCNLLCIFCQNYDISHQGVGREVSPARLAEIMLTLQNSGCHNINLVTPSHVVPQFLAALDLAIKADLKLPIVYNSSAYDNLATLRLLDGVIDIYMPDFKFWHSDFAELTCNAPDYPKVARRALREMHRQVGDLVVDKNGIAFRGLLVRHLVMPGRLDETRAIMRFLAREISENTYVNVMPQYRPCGRAFDIRTISAPLSADEYESALQAAREEGLTRLDNPRRVFRIW